jgi:predicted SPOUT superfamily RNA methylase MTH1
MSDLHRPELKHGVTVRLSASEWARLRVLARADDRSLNGYMVRIVRSHLADKEETS